MEREMHESFPMENDKSKFALDYLRSALLDSEKNRAQFIEFVRNFFQKNSYEEVVNWQSALQKIQSENPNIVVRREDPEKLFDLVAENKPYSIEFQKGTHADEAYPNIALLGSDMSGLKQVYTRGFSELQKGVVLVAGFSPNGLNTVQNLPPDKYEHYSSEDRRTVRMAEGTIRPEDLKFVLMRVPRKFFPESNLTDDEFDSETPFITRMYRAEQNTTIN